MPTCEQCKWWKAPARDDQGNCNRFPQHVKTHKSYFCGEFCWGFVAGEEPEKKESEPFTLIKFGREIEKMKEEYFPTMEELEIPIPELSISESVPVVPLPPKKQQKRRS